MEEVSTGFTLVKVTILHYKMIQYNLKYFLKVKGHK